MHKAGGTTVCCLAAANRENHIEVKSMNCNGRIPWTTTHVRKFEGTGLSTQGCCGNTLEQQLAFYARSLLTFVANENVLPDGELDTEHYDFFTTLRDPLARSISHYLHVMRGTHNGMCNPAPGRDSQYAPPGFREWVVHQPDNFYVRTLNGPTVFELPRGAINATHLMVALNRLTQFRGVLITELYNESLPLLHEWFRWEITDDCQHRNSRPSAQEEHATGTETKADTHSTLTLDEQVQYFGYDRVVYAYATNLFHNTSTPTPTIADLTEELTAIANTPRSTCKTESPCCGGCSVRCYHNRNHNK